jgi:ribosomal protein S18 acetylase RimI-like enzyme
MEWIPARGMRNYGQKSSLKELPVKWQGTQTNHAGELYIPPDFPPHMIGIPVKEKVKGFEDGHYYNGWDVKESKLTPAQKLAKKKELENKLIDSGFSQKAASLISLQEISKQSYYLPGHRSAIALRDPETNDWHLDIAPHESFTHQGSMADYLRDLGSPSMRKFVKDEGPNEYYHRHLARGLYNPETREFVHMSHPEGIDEYDFEDPSKEKREVTEKFWQDLAERYDLPIEKIRFLNNYTGEYEDLNPDDIDIKDVEMPWEYKRELMKAIRNRPLNEHERQQGGYDTKTGSRYLYASKWKIAKEDAWETVLDGELGHDIITTGTWEEVKKQTIKWLKQLENGYINKKNPHDNDKIDANAKEQDGHALEDLKLYEEKKRWSFHFDHGKHPYDLIIQPVGYKESKWKLSNVQFEIEGNHIYAIVNNKIVGDLEFINYDDDFDGNKIVEIEFIRVDKQHRRTGIGKLLLEKLYSLYPNHEFQTTGVTPLGEKLINSFERDSGKDVDYWGEASSEFPDEIPDKNSKWKIAAKKKIHHKHYSDLRSHQKAVKHYGPLKTHNVKNFKKKSVLNENQAQELFGQDPYMYHDVAAARTKNGQNEQVTTIGSILRNGILPKEQTGVSEYSDWLTSRPHHAYVGKETFYPKSRVPALRIDMSKVDPSTLAPDEDLFPSFGYSNQLSHLIDFHNVKNPPFEKEHPEGATLGQWAHEHSHLDTPKNVKASKDLIGAIAVKGGIPSDAIHFNPKWLDEVEYKVRFNLEDPEADLESDRYLMELILSNEDRISNDEWDYINPIMELYNELVAEIKRRREMKHSKWKIADYQGWTNYETWNVNTTMVSDYELNKHFHNLVVNGASGNQFIADAIGMVIGPHNKQLQEDFSSMTDDEEVEMMKKNQEEDWWRNAEKHHPDNYLAQEDYVRKMKDITMTFMGEPEPSDIANYWIDESKVNWNEIYNYWKRNAEAEGNQIISKWKIC